MLIKITLISLLNLMLVSCLHSDASRKNNNPITSKPSIGSKSNNQKIATGNTNPLNHLGNFMTLTATGQTNTLNNPLYKLRLYADGKLVDSFITVSGRTFTQVKNRHQSGTQAPLPDGKYTVASSTIPGAITFGRASLNAEAGEHFLPIQATFKTGRSALGFHFDPSFEKSNGEDGTAGCIGLTSTEDLDKLLSFVDTYKPEFLDVQILDKTYATKSEPFTSNQKL